VKLTNYHPHEGQKAFHYAMDHLYRFCALIAGIRGGKTFAGAREATRQAWNAKGKGVYGIIAPTFNMLDRTTWQEFKEAARPLISEENDTKKIITLKNGRRVHGHSAERPDRIRNETFVGFWGDEMREAKNFRMLWDVLLGRVLSTNGKGFITTSPNSYDDIHDIFIAQSKQGYGVVRFPTYANVTLSKEGIDQLAGMYDSQFALQELHGEFVLFQGSVYYCFNRNLNAGDLAYKLAVYDPNRPLALCCDFNVDPMAWVVAQIHINDKGLKEIRVIDEIFLRNSNTVQACQEFKSRYANHSAGVVLYGDATGEARHTDSNVTNWKIIENELQAYGISKRVPTHNPAERDRINAVNGMICNSKQERRVLVNPKCNRLIRDLEQVGFKEGSTQIDKGKDLLLTHMSDALGYLVEKEFSLNRGLITGLKI
jgi:hypothetical protein